MPPRIGDPRCEFDRRTGENILRKNHNNVVSDIRCAFEYGYRDPEMQDWRIVPARDAGLRMQFRPDALRDELRSNGPPRFETSALEVELRFGSEAAARRSAPERSVMPVIPRKGYTIFLQSSRGYACGHHETAAFGPRADASNGGLSMDRGER